MELSFFFFFHFIISKLNIFRYLMFIYRHAAFIQNPLPLNSSFFFYLKTNKHVYTSLSIIRTKKYKFLQLKIFQFSIKYNKYIPKLFNT